MTETSVKKKISAKTEGASTLRAHTIACVTQVLSKAKTKLSALMADKVFVI